MAGWILLEHLFVYRPVDGVSHMDIVDHTPILIVMIHRFETQKSKSVSCIQESFATMTSVQVDGHSKVQMVSHIALLGISSTFPKQAGVSKSKTHARHGLYDE